MSRVSQIFISLNPIVIPILQSRFHCLISTQLMLVKFTGRKSGREFTTPMAYHEFNGTIIIALAETKSRQWWRNYRDVWPMAVLIKGQWKSGYASVVKPTNGEFKKWFEAVFDRAGFIPKIFNIIYNKKQGLSNSQLEYLSSRSALVKFTQTAEEHLLETG